MPSPLMEPLNGIARLSPGAWERLAQNVSPSIANEAGHEREHVAEWEEQLRGWWAALTDLWPTTPGTQPAVQLTTKRFVRLAGGQRSEMARAIRGQALPWLVTERPLADLLARGDDLCTVASGIIDLVTGIRTEAEQIARMEEEFSTIMPRAWGRATAERGLTASALDQIRTRDELEAFTLRLRNARVMLVERLSEFREWVQGREVRDAETLMAGVADSSLEERFDVLMTLSSIDRGPVQRRTTSELRRVMRDHLEQVVEQAPIRGLDIPVRIAQQYSAIDGDATITADEIWSYARAMVAEVDSHNSSARR
ncbi:MAG: hypothetical protein JWM95_42 [Gemmatimonadetes bacterium]|nr:hypothetical protein [Gemmatimonadota bacterium]